MLAGMQIGGSRYPEKRRINLYQRRIKKSTVVLELAAFALFGVALYVFVRVCTCWSASADAAGGPRGDGLSEYGIPA